MIKEAPAGVAPRSIFVRSLVDGPLFEVFLVSAVASLLLIRVFLVLTGFPKVGGGGLHIAHMLWGGLLMVISVVLLLGFVGRPVQYLAAFLSGAGFGTFIDEVGKFVTSDNDYFFRPAVAIIYAVFMLLYLAVRELELRRSLSDRELLAATFDTVREIRLFRRRPAGTRRVLAYLAKQAAGDKLLPALREAIEQAEDEAPLLPRRLARARRAIIHRYMELVASRELNRVVFLLFSVYAAFVVISVLAAVAAAQHGTGGRTAVAAAGILASSAISGGFLAYGAVSLRRSRASALLWFERAVLVDLLLARVFMFYEQQFGALFGLAFDLVVYLLLKGMIRAERRLASHGLLAAERAVVTPAEPAPRRPRAGPARP